VADLADYAWLTGADGHAWLARLADDNRSALAQLDALRRELPAERARLIVEQLDLRRRAIDKFGDRAATMFFTRVHLEQATDLWIACYKARRLANSATVADYCCGIGGDLLGLVESGVAAAGWDSSPVACLLAAANLRGGAAIHCGDVESLAPPPNAAWHLDPDRRGDGRRTTAVVHYAPGPALVERWLAAHPRGVVKLAPATAAPPAWAAGAELEWISRGRECRQQLAWFGPTAEQVGRRRATAVDREGGAATLVGDPHAPIAVGEKPGRFVYDPDPAVVAADLLGALAAKLGAASLGPGAVYLTGDAAAYDRLATCFAVHDCLPLDVRKLAGYFAARSVGQLEIKKRGVAIEPDALRRKLKLRGENAATLIVTRVGRHEAAIVAERVPT
jgi:hypothetical protein